MNKIQEAGLIFVDVRSSSERARAFAEVTPLLDVGRVLDSLSAA